MSSARPEEAKNHVNTGFSKGTHNTNSIIEFKVIYYLEQCGLGVLFFLPLSSINMLPHQQNTINNM